MGRTDSRMPTSRRELITARARARDGGGDCRRDGRHGSRGMHHKCDGGGGRIEGRGEGAGTPQRAVFHWINVTGERRLRFNYRTNLRFDRASVSRRSSCRRGETTRGRGVEMDWKNGERGRNHCNEISATPAVSFYGHRCYSEGSVSVTRARARALFHRADCYWLIDVDRISFFSLFFFPLCTRDASVRGI